MEELIQPSFQTRPYKLKDVVFIRDRYQSYLYCKNLVFPVDMYVSSNDDLVMVFKKNETRELYQQWRNGELN